jgi:hypothetical protein
MGIRVLPCTLCKESMMGRMWVRRKSTGRNYCCTSVITTCYRALLYTPGDDSTDPAVRAATDEINRILSKLQHDDPGRDRRLAFLAFPDGKEDSLRLDWEYEDDEIITASDGNYE